jgi:hypothetical protein
MTTITIEKWFDFWKTNFKDILEFTKYLSKNIEWFSISKKIENNLEIEIENFSDEENKRLISKWWKTIDNIFNSLDLQLWK